MVLSKDDREWIMMTSKLLVYKVIKGVLSEHINNCPHGQKQNSFKHLLIGIKIGAGIFGSGVGIANLIAKIAGVF